MMTSPYQLNAPGQKQSFYQAVQDFAHVFTHSIEERYGNMIDGHLALQSAEHPQLLRSRGEYAIELLTLGILRREYGVIAMLTPESTIERLTELWNIRSKDSLRKRQADQERAEIIYSMLNKDNGSYSKTFTLAFPTMDLAMDDRKLCRWLTSTGEFIQESLRLSTWLNESGVFWSLDELLHASAELAEWFVRQGSQRLGMWTQNVQAYVAQVHQSMSPREDLLLISRPQELYHLNMLGAEVMNRGFLPGFLQRHHTVLLVPGCMRARSSEACQAIHQGYDIICTECNPNCHVAKLQALSQEHHFEVYIVPHASTFTAWLEHWQKRPDTRLIAAACPLHLVPGGYEMRALGLEAQCILLEYSGCQKHWDPAGTPTRLDVERLKQLLKNEQYQAA